MNLCFSIVYIASLAILLQMNAQVDSSKNEIQFQKLVCKRPPNKKVADFFCDVKKISHNRIKLVMWMNVTEPIFDAWVHTQLYYRFNGLTYQKFPVDLWENACAWLSGSTKAHILGWTVGKVVQYTNMNHTCPYDGHVYAKVDNISVDNFLIEQMLPAGKFRVDVNVTSGNRSDLLAMSQMFISVSDNRVERW